MAALAIGCLWGLGLLSLALCFSTARRLRAAETAPRPPQGRTAVIVPCRGPEPALPDLMAALAQQTLPHCDLYFVFADGGDGAIPLVRDHLHRHAGAGRLIIQPPPPGYDAKIANMLRGIDAALADDADFLVFLDSDVIPPPAFIAHLLEPLCRENVLLSTGARVLVPAEGAVAQWATSLWLQGSLPGVAHPDWGSAWGGAMALRARTVERLDVKRLWAGAFSDDHTLSRAVRDAGGDIAFAPACLVPSPLQGSWPQLLDFTVRQLLVLRLHDRRLWFFTWTMLYPLAALLLALAWLAAGRVAWAAAGTGVLLLPVTGFYLMNEALWGRLRRPGLRLAAQPPHLQAAAIFALIPLHAAALLRAALLRRFTWRGRHYELSGRGIRPAGVEQPR